VDLFPEDRNAIASDEFQLRRRSLACGAFLTPNNPCVMPAHRIPNRIVAHPAWRGNSNSTIGPIDADVQVADLFPRNLDVELVGIDSDEQD
jgi:hypothetical protein